MATSQSYSYFGKMSHADKRGSAICRTTLTCQEYYLNVSFQIWPSQIIKRISRYISLGNLLDTLPSNPLPAVRLLSNRKKSNSRKQLESLIAKLGCFTGVTWLS